MGLLCVSTQVSGSSMICPWSGWETCLGALPPLGMVKIDLLCRCWERGEKKAPVFPLWNLLWFAALAATLKDHRGQFLSPCPVVLSYWSGTWAPQHLDTAELLTWCAAWVRPARIYWRGERFGVGALHSSTAIYICACSAAGNQVSEARKVAQCGWVERENVGVCFWDTSARRLASFLFCWGIFGCWEIKIFFFVQIYIWYTPKISVLKRRRRQQHTKSKMTCAKDCSNKNHGYIS